MIGINPVGQIVFNYGQVSVEGMIEPVGQTSKPLEALREIMGRYGVSGQEQELPPFGGGLAGYISYDMLRYYERLPNRPTDGLGFPEAHFLLTTELVVYDHLKNIIKIICLIPQNGSPTEKAAANDRIVAIMKMIKTNREAIDQEKQDVQYTVASNFTKQGFLNAVIKAKEYIEKGDIFQVVLSQRLKCAFDSDPFMVYRSLRSLNPSPYMFFMDFGSYQILGSSPECLVRLENGVVENCPIAGTRPRGKTAKEDAMLAQELLGDEKERAEHAMLVDLGRNDIGRVSKIGTVAVEDYMHVETFSHVMHLVTRVKGELDKQYDAFDALLACFPAGTVSGAPKLRAMEIIDELEPSERGPYAGAVGYFDFRGNMDTCITIRSAYIKDGYAYLQAGAGIVADSVPESEYFETLNKLKAMLKALGIKEETIDDLHHR